MNPQIYTSATSVIATIPLEIDGVQIIAQSVQYRIIDANEVELLAKTTVPNYSSGSPNATITVPALINTITGSDTREMRIIELYINDGSGELIIDYAYVIQLKSVLIQGVNSFQSYGKSLLTALTIQNIPGWDSATKDSRTNALIEARRSIGALPLRHYYNDLNTTHFDGGFIFRDITLLTKDQYLALPQDLKDALCRAQLLQANYLLADDENEAMRESGIIGVTVGEAKNLYRAGIAHKGIINKRAMVELSRWLISGKRISR